MMRSIWTGVALCSLAAAAPAHAVEYIFDSNGDEATINFNGFNDSNGDILGLNASLGLRLLSGIGTANLLFEYDLRNTSTAAFSSSRVSAFSFDSDPDASNAIINLGDFSNILTGGSFPNGIHDVEICLNDGGNACAGGGNGGATITDPATGRFTLSFAQAPTNGVTLDRFYVRYQSLPNNVGGSASGQEITTAVPEPGSWMLILTGFFALGFALRRRPVNVVGAKAYA